ncbi:alpha/beta fold hydrolase [Streptomyces sp. NPDC048639]|uniref:alpha/beta fold hydrolase n=1 Tax=Streptomyces sp. NPDC048639 TaxID=3365581 RepID=UPI00371F8B69
MSTVISRDGTSIAYERTGDGWPVILVGGALNDGPAGEPFAELLAPHFTVFTYDRRGRRASGDTPPYAVAREVEDLEAVIEEAGGTASVCGLSSGGALVLEAAAAGLSIAKSAVFEVPYALDWGHRDRTADYGNELARLLAAGDRGGALTLFMRYAGAPDAMIDEARRSPFWPGLEELAPSLAYDAAVMGDGMLPVGRLGAVGVPTLVIDGGDSPRWLREASRAIAAAIPGGRQHTVEGQTHDVSPGALTTVLREYFS